jgi:hypothetical protein
MKTALLLLTTAIMMVAADCTVAAFPFRFKVIQSLPTEVRGRWCYHDWAEDKTFAELRRCNQSAQNAISVTITPTAIAFRNVACRIGSVFAWNNPDGWHAMVECKGPATDEHYIYHLGLIGGDRLGVREVTETNPSPLVGRYTIEKLETTPQR